MAQLTCSQRTANLMMMWYGGMVGTDRSGYDGGVLIGVSMMMMEWWPKKMDSD